MKPDVCIYHAPCQDGFTAAWAIWRRWPDVQFLPGVYGQAPPLEAVAGKDVLLVDFSYKAPVLAQLAKHARTVTILDHHKSAEADLAAFAVAELRHPEDLICEAMFAGKMPIQALFDMTRSGARMAWDYAFPEETPPWLVLHVEDRDLWRFDLDHTREIAADLFSWEYDFGAWSNRAAALQTSLGFREARQAGEAILRKQRKDIDELLGITTRYMVIGGHRVPVANMPYTLASEAANQLAEGNPFAACYYDNAEGRRVFSLRALDGGADVSVIAASYGGGGHAKAAGFTAPWGWEGDGSEAVGLLVAERRRQVEVEGWTPEHDDRHDLGQLARAAACYAVGNQIPVPGHDIRDRALKIWPWAAEWWKPASPLRMLVKAGALILAEIERRLRAGERP